MASIIPGYEYDIFISYRQKDNKGERWASAFVTTLKTELASILKEEAVTGPDYRERMKIKESQQETPGRPAE